MSDEIVPFGKYKGQPVAALQQDKSYLDWLTAQSWFRERHVALYTTIINNFQEPTETPQHNALQARFLDDNFAKEFIRRASGFCPHKIIGREFEIRAGFDVGLTYLRYAYPNYPDYEYDHGSVAVEIKPEVSDDYPAVLRQMTAAIRNAYGYDRYALFTEVYTGKGASRSQFVDIFKFSGIKVVFGW